MFFENYRHIKNKEIYTLTLLILFSVFIRVPAIFLYGDTGLENEWLILVRNLINHGTLAFSYHDENLAKFLFPNLYMPPLYPWFIYIFKLLNLNHANSLTLILYVQAALASISMVTFYFNSIIYFNFNNNFLKIYE